MGCNSRTQMFYSLLSNFEMGICRNKCGDLYGRLYGSVFSIPLVLRVCSELQSTIDIPLTWKYTHLNYLELMNILDICIESTDVSMRGSSEY